MMKPHQTCCGCLAHPAEPGDTYCAGCRAYITAADPDAPLSWEFAPAVALDAAGQPIATHPDQLDLGDA